MMDHPDRQPEHLPLERAQVRKLLVSGSGWRRLIRRNHRPWLHATLLNEMTGHVRRDATKAVRSSDCDLCSPTRLERNVIARPPGEAEPSSPSKAWDRWA